MTEPMLIRDVLPAALCCLLVPTVMRNADGSQRPTDLDCEEALKGTARDELQPRSEARTE